MIPYGHQSINKKDVEAVTKALNSDWLTQGPKILEFEKKLADYCGAKYAVVVSNGTAALHAAYYASGLNPGDEIITAPITFPATTNAALWQKLKPVFVDIDKNTGNINPDLIEKKITSKTKAIVPIDYTGRPIDFKKINAIAKKYNLLVIEDACQALGASYKNKKIGSLGDLTIFSFHPVKSITTGEGGAILTNNKIFYKRMKTFVTHGVTKKNFINSSPGEWYFEMQDLGQNYRLTDLQCALGISQLARVDEFITARQKIAAKYHTAFAGNTIIKCPPLDNSFSKSAWHLYVIQLTGKFSKKRAEIFKQLRKAGIGVQVHHIPVYLHPYYQKLGYTKGLCPEAENFYKTIISLPIYPDLSKNDQNYIIKKIKEIIN